MIHTFESYTNSQETITLYHGGSSNVSNSFYTPFYLSYDKSQAEAYARGNGGVVTEFEIKKSDIIDEDIAKEVLIEMGLQSKDENWDVATELNFYEIIDYTFDTSLSDEDLEIYFNELISRGIKAIEFLDMNIKTNINDIYNVVVLDKSVLNKKGA
jgi:hypothetical protein